MLLRTLVLEDVGQFGGRHEFDLVPRASNGQAKPIVLFGGHNGSGKTTLLNSIPLCLYGRAFLGDRVANSKYQEFLFRMIHWNSLKPILSSGASIQVVFEQVVLGVTEQYDVTRRWTTETGTQEAIQEKLTIKKDGALLTAVDESNWSDFLLGLLPIGLTQLFFFDGEKIDRLADDNTNAELASSVRSLLGVNLVERLEARLQIYIDRERAKQGSELTQAKLEALRQKIDQLGGDLKAGRRKLMVFQTEKIDPSSRDIEKATLDLQASGSNLAKRFEEAVMERETVKASIRAAQIRVKELAAGVLPFAICRELSQELRTLLRTSKPFVADLNDLLDRFVAGDLDGAKKIRKPDRRVVRNVLEKESEHTASESARIVLGGLSDSEQQWVTEILSGALDHVAKEASELSEKLNFDMVQSEQFDEQEAIIPEEEALRPQQKHLQKLHEAHGSFMEQKRFQEAEISKNELKIERFQSQHTKLLNEIKEVGDTDGRIENAEAAKRALEDYKEEAALAKIQQLETELTLCFGQLCQKTDLVEHFKIDSDTFATTLVGKTGSVVSKESLSAGERQILGIAILWALGRTSGRPLPIMIDTPLARLDREHRQLLLDRYFPQASHQVVIFSTDTEVDESLLEQIRPKVSHVFHLRYDKTTKRTVSKEGYFWQDEDREVSNQPTEAFK